MDSRRDFLKKAALLAGTSVTVNNLPESIQKALAIDADPGTTYLDAEHIVFLMQENRSFDHCFGTLKGVRGFNDPRAMKQPNGLPVWVQGNKKGQYYAPFHLDIVNSKSTWMGSLPHGWRDMVAARNNGKMDNWLEAKSSGNKAYKDIPLTMGYYNRADIPFYYAFADAFTVCDQHFCSSLTGTSANRSYFWSGAVREQPRDPESVAHVDNGQINYKDVSWKTFPERLEEEGVSWKVYQNELSIPVGLSDEEEDWLANFTDNNLEFYKQYNVRFHPKHRAWMHNRIAAIRIKLKEEKEANEIEKLNKELTRLLLDIDKYSEANFQKLSPHEKAIHEKAFVTNVEDPNYHKLEKLSGTHDAEVNVPAGDIFYQFRKDVDRGKLPTVSWLVAPCRFSDHPGSPWYGAWYVSEALDILTKNPDIWKKTIFVLTYDENDGYFDHIAPFVPPLSSRDDVGRISGNIDTADEYVTMEQERKRTGKPDATLDSPIGLGYRVPMVVASPWSKGGFVNSEVFDLTSGIQFIEHFLEKKKGIRVREDNISDWRRMVTGDMTSIFRAANHFQRAPIDLVDRDVYVSRIYAAKSKNVPNKYVEITQQELSEIKNNSHFKPNVPLQEKGFKPACALPVELQLNVVCKGSNLSMLAQLDKRIKSASTEAIPYFVIAYHSYVQEEPGKIWNFAIAKDDDLRYDWDLNGMKGDLFSFAVHGPNGFYRSFDGNKNYIPSIEVKSFNRLGKTFLSIKVHASDGPLQIEDKSYGLFQAQKLTKGLEIDCSKSKGWYDVEVTNPKDTSLRLRYAGHIENGNISITDPLMAG